MHYTKRSFQETLMNTHHYLTHALMTHELYKVSNPHVQRELHTHIDIKALFTAQQQYHEGHGKMNYDAAHQFAKENQRSRGGGMGL